MITIIGVVVGVLVMVWAWKNNTPPEEQPEGTGGTVGIAIIGLMIIFASFLYLIIK